MKPRNKDEVDSRYKLMKARIEADELSGKTVWLSKREMVWKIG